MLATGDDKINIVSYLPTEPLFAGVQVVIAVAGEAVQTTKKNAVRLESTLGLPLFQCTLLLL